MSQTQQAAKLNPLTLQSSCNFSPAGYRRDNPDSLAEALTALNCPSNSLWCDVAAFLWSEGFRTYAPWLSYSVNTNDRSYLFKGWLIRDSNDFFSVAVTARGLTVPQLSFTLINRGKTKLYQTDVLSAEVQIISDDWKERILETARHFDEEGQRLYESAPKCPKCNAMMIQKIMKMAIAGIDGKAVRRPHPHEGEMFYGCANYPACRGMRAPWVPEDQAKEVGDIASDLSCPLCGNAVVVRQARYGRNKGNKFFGCINYPECKGLLTMEEAVARKLMR